MKDEILKKISAAVRDIPDFPKKGILFKDIMPLLGDAELFPEVIKAMAAPFRNAGITKVLGSESRGFLLAAPIAMELKAGLVPVRKKGKLPYKTVSASYALEYGTDTLEIHEDAIKPGEKVLIVDDVLATGGTAAAMKELVEKLGGSAVGVSMLIELPVLNGKEKLGDSRLFSLLKY
jgi:adenine phosphoribosyltransferase